MAKLRKFLLLSSAEQRLFLKAGLLLVIMRLGLWLLPFPSLMRLVAHLSRPGSKVRPADPVLLEKISWAVKAASPYLPRPTCLTQALTTQTMLKSWGFPADLHIGVAKDENGQFQAHAWIVSGGRVIIGSEEHESYVPFGSISTSAALPGACS